MARVWVEAYGCAASFADSEMISGILVNGGHTLAKSSRDADASVIVTCSVKDATANRMRHRIRVLSKGPLVVAGCLPKAEISAVENITRTASMLGPNSLGSTLEVVNSAVSGERLVRLDDTDITKTGIPKVRINPAIGIIEIASGCMSECTFCQTKLSKGDLRSYRVGDIVRQAASEIEDGCREIWLSSTDNGCYGLDIGSTLPELVSRVSDIPGDFMIRVGMMNPMYMPRIRDALIESYAHPKVFRFVHVPVQSGSDRVLHDMKRGHTGDTFRNIVRKLRERFENFTVSTDVIVGFPTETEADFEGTVSLIEETRPDIVNLSRYSARPGTDAALMHQQDASVTRRRSRILHDLCQRISRERNSEWMGWEGDVLFDEFTPSGTRGRNHAYRAIYADEADIVLGSTERVRITGYTDHALLGEIL